MSHCVPGLTSSYDHMAYDECPMICVCVMLIMANDWLMAQLAQLFGSRCECT